MSDVMKSLPKHSLIALLMLILSACSALERTDIPGTQIAENIGFSTEVAALSQTAVGEQATHSAETDALINEAALVNAVNNQLLGTLQAVVTPTMVLIQDDSVELASLPSNVRGSRLYVGTGITGIIDNDGCITARTISFDPGIPRIYATMVVYNITAETTMTVEWFRGDELAFSDSWQATQDDAKICVWFDLDPNRVQLLPGEWVVRAYVDGFPVINPMTFIVNGE